MEILIDLFIMSKSDQEIELWNYHIKRISDTTDNSIGIVRSIIRKSYREVSFIYEYSVIINPFCFEACKLESNVELE